MRCVRRVWKQSQDAAVYALQALDIQTCFFQQRTAREVDKKDDLANTGPAHHLILVLKSGGALRRSSLGNFACRCSWSRCLSHVYAKNVKSKPWQSTPLWPENTYRNFLAWDNLYVCNLCSSVHAQDKATQTGQRRKVLPEWVALLAPMESVTWFLAWFDNGDHHDSVEL